MSKLATLGRAIGVWYISVPLLAVAGILVGYAVFFHVFPGKPKIGVIDIPYTILDDNTAFEIGAYLDYARRTDSIKAVVVRLNSPGGGAAASEQLYLETRKLREEKPVVVVMNDIVASGGYMMALGANHTYTKGSSLVGSVGVVLSFPGPMVPSTPNENVVVTGPAKQSGGFRRDWIATADVLKQGFAQMVVNERGDRLNISADRLMEAKIYSGIEAVRLGMVDEIGGDVDALDKAADLAGISNYELVDVNVEVARIFVEKSRRITESLYDGGGLDEELALRLLLERTSGEDTGDAADQRPLGRITDLESLRDYFDSGDLARHQEEALPEFPLEINGPNIYYVYVGPSE